MDGRGGGQTRNTGVDGHGGGPAGNTGVDGRDPRLGCPSGSDHNFIILKFLD